MLDAGYGWIRASQTTRCSLHTFKVNEARAIIVSLAAHRHLGHSGQGKWTTGAADLHLQGWPLH